MTKKTFLNKIIAANAEQNPLNAQRRITQAYKDRLEELEAANKRDIGFWIFWIVLALIIAAAFAFPHIFGSPNVYDTGN